MDLSRTMDITRVADLTRIAESTRTLEVTRITPQTPQYTPTFTPPQLPPSIRPWIGTGIDLDFMKQLKKQKPAKTMKITKYTPSLVAVGFDIRKAVNTKRMFTGIEIRPIPMPKRRKR
jgi:outer membrane protein W